MFTRDFIHAGHTARFTITRDSLGWDVREERDNTVVKQVRYNDWHRVERAMQAFEFRRDQSLAESRQS